MCLPTPYNIYAHARIFIYYRSQLIAICCPPATLSKQAGNKKAQELMFPC